MSRQGGWFRVPNGPVRYRLRARRRSLVLRRTAAPSDASLTPVPIPGSLADGIAIPEYGVRVPWGITRAELFRLIPRCAFRRDDHWPTLRFTLFGVTKVYGFNFYGDNGGLCAIQFDGRTPRRRTFRRIGHQLIAALGRPNFVDLSLHGQQTWVLDNTVIEQAALCRARRGRTLDIVEEHHSLHVFRRARR